MNIIEKALEKLEEEIEQELADKRDGEPAAPESGAAGAGQGGTASAPSGTGAAVERPAQDTAAAPQKAPVAREEAAGAQAHAASSSREVTLDLERLSRAGFLTPGDSRSLIAEEHRLIKRPLLRRATPGDPASVEHGNVIIVTSSLPHEGKTYISVNLAMSIAMEVDRRVLLVDADVAKSDVTRILGVSNERGLSSYLSGAERDLSKLLLRTNVESLTVLPSGPNLHKMTELLASDQMRRLVDELSTRYPDRIVLFDSPPLLATSGASVLTNLMGQVVMVVEAVRTPQSALREALRHLTSLDNVAIVLNKHRRGMVPGYGYRYGYGYGYGYGDRPPEG